MPSSDNHVAKKHVVKKGESLYSISRAYKVRLDELLAWNNKSQRSVIHPGDVLTIWTKK
jgi:LysM repeat protein